MKSIHIRGACLLGALVCSLVEGAVSQAPFGMDGMGDSYAASGMMGMGGSFSGQGAAFVSSESKVSEEVRIVAAAGNASLCWGIVDMRMGLEHRVVGLQPCSPRSHGQKWLLRRTGATLQFHPALFTFECLELAAQPGTGNVESGGDLEWSRIETGRCHARQNPMSIRQTFRLDSKRRISLGSTQNLCLAASGDQAGSIFLAVKCDDSHLQRLFIPAFSKAKEGSRWFTELLYGGSESPHCLGVTSSKLLGLEPCAEAGLALSRQLFTVLGGGSWVMLQPSAQWGMCIGLEHVESENRGAMHEEARLAGHHITSQSCLSDHVGQAWMFDEWDRIRVPETDWCLSAPIVSETVDGLMSLQTCSHAKEQRFFVHPHQIAKQVAPEETYGQAYGMGRGTEAPPLFGRTPTTPRIHAPGGPQNQPTATPTPAAPSPAVPTPPASEQPTSATPTQAAPAVPTQPTDQAGANGARPEGSQVGGMSHEQWVQGVRRSGALPDTHRRTDQGFDAGAVSQSEFLNFCRQAREQGASVSTLQAAGCSDSLGLASSIPAGHSTAGAPQVVLEPAAAASPVGQQQVPPATVLPVSTPLPSPPPQQEPSRTPGQPRSPPTWKRKSPPSNSQQQEMPQSPAAASHQQRHLQEDPTPSPGQQKSSQPGGEGGHGYLSRHVDVHTMHEHELEIVHWLLLGGCGVLLAAAAFMLLKLRLGQPRRLRRVPGPVQMLRNATQRRPAHVATVPPGTSVAVSAEEKYGQALSPTAHAKMMASRSGRFSSIPGLRSSIKSRAASSDQGQFNL